MTVVTPNGALPPIPISSSPSIGVFQQSGTNYAAALNQDGTANSAANPAAPGSIVSLFVTGLDLSLTANTDGALWKLSDAEDLTEALGIEVGSVLYPATLPALYAGPAPGLIDGVIQINVKLPSSPPNLLPLTVRQSLGTGTESNTVQVYVAN